MVATPGYGVFAPEPQGGVPPATEVCNGYKPIHAVTGRGPFYISPDCATTLTDCQMNALSSEILAAVDWLGYPYNSNLVDNLGRALEDKFALQQADIDGRIKRAGDTMEGPLDLVCPPANDNEAACKRYVDDAAQAAADACCAHMQTQLDNAAAGLQADIDNRVRRDGDVMTGPLHLSGDPTVGDEAATKDYVDHASGLVIIAPTAPIGIPERRLWWSSVEGRMFLRYNDGNSIQWVEVGGGGAAGGAVGNFLPISGGTLTGPLTLAGDPTTNLQAATKFYVDQQIALGGTFVDAPADGQLWARQNNQWAAVAAGLDDAPADGETYGRQDNQWVSISGFGDVDGGTF